MDFAPVFAKRKDRTVDQSGALQVTEVTGSAAGTADTKMGQFAFDVTGRRITDLGGYRALVGTGNDTRSADTTLTSKRRVVTCFYRTFCEHGSLIRGQTS